MYSIFTGTHRNTFTFQKTATNASRILLLDRVPPLVSMLLFLPLNFAQDKLALGFVSHQQKWPPEGLCTVPGRPAWSWPQRPVLSP